jgi:hypothetical protein
MMKKMYYKTKHTYRKNKYVFWGSGIIILVGLFYLLSNDYFAPNMKYSDFLKSLEYGQIEIITFR